ncbi:SpoVA/SpoVAEb family sporulation membrane protein [Rubeoparvulum massiliense]|uniref:SpoVA/SpoVAEb family sporulation membrane protein n=1 Tax=Rubeoparvulum massiliense TaxID=1631346 RepID=UPI00065E6E8A|nr:SpoVA/SpoVAEb family sporulation membrane protein [Rubeoparvulum massiliense]
MLGKPMEYIWAFIIGGFISILAQASIMFYRAIGVSASWSVTWMLATMAVFGVIMTVLGVYRKWEEKTAIGAYMPFSGAAAFAVECMSDALVRGEKMPQALWSGIKILVFLYGSGIIVCMIIAAIVVYAG